jgi:Leucine-rich repeat (LRR) protein
MADRGMLCLQDVWRIALVREAVLCYLKPKDAYLGDTPGSKGGTSHERDPLFCCGRFFCEAFYGDVLKVYLFILPRKYYEEKVKVLLSLQEKLRKCKSYAVKPSTVEKEVFQLSHLLPRRNIIEHLTFDNITVDMEKYYFSDFPQLQQLVFKNRRCEDLDLNFLFNCGDIETLEFTNMGVKDISGLEFCNTVQKVDLSVNHITDIAPLVHCRGIDTVILHRNHGLKDITAMSKCESLTKLDLSWTNVKDLTPLVACRNLKILILYYNNLVDITAIGEITGIKQLDLSSNDIVDVTALGKCQQLVKLDISFNEKMEKLTGLEKCMYLQELDLRGNCKLENISDVKRYASIQCLKLGNNSVVTDMNKLEEVRKYFHGITTSGDSSPMYDEHYYHEYDEYEEYAPGYKYEDVDLWECCNKEDAGWDGYGYLERWEKETAMKGIQEVLDEKYDVDQIEWRNQYEAAQDVQYEQDAEEIWSEYVVWSAQYEAELKKRKR